MDENATTPGDADPAPIPPPAVGPAGVTGPMAPQMPSWAPPVSTPPPAQPSWPAGEWSPPSGVVRDPGRRGPAATVVACAVAIVLALTALVVSLRPAPTVCTVRSSSSGPASTICTVGSPSPGPVATVNTAKLPTTAGTVAAVAQSLTPSVGTLVASNSNSGASGLGSTFVISDSGTTTYLLTNNHVVAGANNLVLIMSSGKRYNATLVGTDTVYDIAVVSVTDGHLPVATFGDSAGLVAGQQVVAIGSPLGDQNSITSGVISALHRTIAAGDESTGSSESLPDVLQTDASINPGNSGGPLADMAGRVVGVNVATSSGGTNVSFSIPGDEAQTVAFDIIGHRQVDHPYLGVVSITPLDAAEQGLAFAGPGVQITDVAAGTPAAAAGLRTGDVIISVDGTPLDSTETLASAIGSHHVGDAITLSIKRGAQLIQITATVGQRPPA